MIAHGEVTVHGAKMALVSLANVSAERIGHTKAAADEYMILISIQKRGLYPTSTFPGKYRASTPGSSGKRSWKR